MSKERELLNALKESVEKDPYGNGAEVAQDAAQQVPLAADGAAATTSNLDMNGILDFFNVMGASMIDDPVFYLKITGLLIIAVIILVFAFELILGS